LELQWSRDRVQRRICRVTERRVRMKKIETRKRDLRMALEKVRRK